MKTRLSPYWLCQLLGWTFYGAALIFLAKVFDYTISGLFIRRILLWLFMGLFFTHLLREIITHRKLLPPLSKKQWTELLLLVITICGLYSFITSSLVEWLQLYDSKMKASFAQRLTSEIFYNSPIVIVWASIYYVWHYIDATRESQMDKVRLEGLVKELELKTIRSHINPHFIFNALNSIRALVDENPERARTAITELSNILRSSMKADTLETSPLERELNIVKDYLALEHIRFEDRLHIEYDIDEDTLDQQVPPMMLQTLVENAIKHGISKQVDGGIVKIISDFRSNHHELIVQNTGRLNSEINPEGFGIQSTYNRLKLLYGAKANFEIKNLNGNLVEAKVILPVQSL
ncbi:sensor histidine kinase [Foetidibacter luteolus]|uniref:sensor histidine kinase n=1 Tax=Foetidibacter luteolus TaxID=2608880 RepID=UPI00129BDD04|nr:histidine kinase [Foetidibacter luteolus]